MQSQSTHPEFLDFAHTVHVLLIMLGEARPWSVSATVDIIDNVSIFNAIKAVLLLRSLRDIRRGRSELRLILHRTSRNWLLFNGRHGGLFVGNWRCCVGGVRVGGVPEGWRLDKLPRDKKITADSDKGTTQKGQKMRALFPCYCGKGDALSGPHSSAERAEELVRGVLPSSVVTRDVPTYHSFNICTNGS
jgi:hypothetical protein